MQQPTKGSQAITGFGLCPGTGNIEDTHASLRYPIFPSIMRLKCFFTLFYEGEDLFPSFIMMKFSLPKDNREYNLYPEYLKRPLLGCILTKWLKFNSGFLKKSGYR